MNKDPNFKLGIILVFIGIGACFVLDPWFLGVAFILFGGHRLYIAYRAGSAGGAPGLD